MVNARIISYSKHLFAITSFSWHLIRIKYCYRPPPVQLIIASLLEEKVGSPTAVVRTFSLGTRTSSARKGGFF